jgi:uncharacterized protein (TIGR03435 family)
MVVPPSLPNGRFDIAAKIPVGTTREGFYLMFQNLLKERLGLVAHIEAREMSRYELVVAKDGPRMSAAKTPNTTAQTRQLTEEDIDVAKLPRDKDGWPILPTGVEGIFAATNLPYYRTMYRGQPPSILIGRLETSLERPVVDKTGLSGLYDFDVTLERSEQGNAPGPQSSLDRRSEMTARLIAAIERLGLKLVSGKGPVEVVVVDRVNSVTTEN